jgi:hypothetical protein
MDMSDRHHCTEHLAPGSLFTTVCLLYSEVLPCTNFANNFNRERKHMGKERCYKCNKLRTDLKTIDDKLCEPCFQKNEKELTATIRRNNGKNVLTPRFGAAATATDRQFCRIASEAGRSIRSFACQTVVTGGNGRLINCSLKDAGGSTG